MEIQRQRQRHLAEACRRRGGGHVTSDKPRLPKHVLASIFAVDKIRTLYCVLGKVASTSWMQVYSVAKSNGGALKKCRARMGLGRSPHRGRGPGGSASGQELGN